MLKTMHGLVEDTMYIYQGDIPISGGDIESGGEALPEARSKLAVRYPRGSSAYLHKNPTTRP